MLTLFKENKIEKQATKRLSSRVTSYVVLLYGNI